MRLERDETGKIISITRREEILLRTTVLDPSLTTTTEPIRKLGQNIVDGFKRYFVGDGTEPTSGVLHSDNLKELAELRTKRNPKG